MRASLAGALLLTGLGVGAVSFYPSILPQQKVGSAGNAVVEPSAPTAQRGASGEAARVFSAKSPLLSAARETPGARPAPEKAVVTERKAAGDGWEAVVVDERNAPLAPVPSALPAYRKSATSKPGDDTAKMELARDLQRELKRVGCYDGEVNGQWSPATKKAMGAFTDRVNATLPVEEPDFILLTLVQGHAKQACGTTCPAGQTIGAGGRCLPSAIVAKAEKKPEPRRERTNVAAAAQPQGATKTTAETPAATWGTTTTVVAAPAPVVTPKVVTQQPAAVAAAHPKTPAAPAPKVAAAAPQQNMAAASITAEPLPGRMAIGGPKTEEPAPAVSVTQPPVVVVPQKAVGTPSGAQKKPVARAQYEEGQPKKPAKSKSSYDTPSKPQVSYNAPKKPRSPAYFGITPYGSFGQGNY